jgi:ATP-dependent RNA helicase DDX27
MGSFVQESKGGKKAKKGQSLVDEAYRRAKSMKATSKRLPDAGKGKIDKKAKQHSDKVLSRREEMHELFENDMTEWKQGRNLKKNNTFARQKSKNAFKSKSRYVIDVFVTLVCVASDLKKNIGIESSSKTI